MLLSFHVSSLDYQSLQDMLFRLFHVVLMYSFQEEQEGFAVWVKTCAALHAYVSHTFMPM